jgi:hypothetical protein
VICVAQAFGQQCHNDGTWEKPTNQDPIDKVCAGAKISVPGTPPAQCIYHDVKYAPGAVICVAPEFGQACSSDGVWGPASTEFDKKCDKAQIPAPTYPTAPAAAK